MFDFGFWEIAIIGIITLIVVGPEKMPSLARKAGLYFGKFNKFLNKIKSDINEELKVDELKEQLSMDQEKISLSEVAEEVHSSIHSLEEDNFLSKEELKKYKTDDDINFERAKKSTIFKNKYFFYNSELGLPSLKDERFYKLYEISSFPFQGVELHKAVLSYHFAFNNLLTHTDNIHRLPFILDSVFKEDIDGGNRIKILKFITKNFPTDTQTILSIADDKNQDTKIEEYKRDIFKDDAHLICIGNGEKEKALLKENDNSQKELIEDTFTIIENI